MSISFLDYPQSGLSLIGKYIFYHIGCHCYNKALTEQFSLALDGILSVTTFQCMMDELSSKFKNMIRLVTCFITFVIVVIS